MWYVIFFSDEESTYTCNVRLPHKKLYNYSRRPTGPRFLNKERQKCLSKHVVWRIYWRLTGSVYVLAISPKCGFWCWLYPWPVSGIVNFSMSSKDFNMFIQGPALRIRNRIRLCRIRMFWDLPDPGYVVWIWIPIRIPPSPIKYCKKNLDSYSFVTSFWLLIFEKWCKCTFKK